MRYLLLIFFLFICTIETKPQKIHLGANFGLGAATIDRSDDFFGQSSLSFRRRTGISLIYENKIKLIISFLPSTSKFRFSKTYVNPGPQGGTAYILKQSNIHLPILVGKSFYINDDFKILLRGGIDFKHCGPLRMEIREYCGPWSRYCYKDSDSFGDNETKHGYMVDLLMLTVDRKFNVSVGVNYYQSLDSFDFIYNERETKIHENNLSFYFYVGV